MKMVASLGGLLVWLTVCDCSIPEVVEPEGQNATLLCKYNIRKHGKVKVCWGKGELPINGCSGQLITTNGAGVVEGSRRSSRFQMLGDLSTGDVSLTIKHVTTADSGLYGCRVQIWGPLNDEKHQIKLTVTKAPESMASTASDHVTFTEQTPSNQTRGPMNSTQSEDIPITLPTQPEEIEASSSGPGVLAFIVPIVVLASAAGVVFIAWRVRRPNGAAHVIHLSAGSEQFSPSASGLVLHSPRSVVENIYQIEEINDYEFCL